MYSDLKIVTGSSNPDLAKAICNHLGCQLTPTLATTFSDGELRIEIGDNVRGDDVFVVQPTCPPTINRNLVQLCLMLDALKRASAGRITAVIPYYGYARQDRKVSPRAPISAKMVADFISVAGAERVVTIDLHAGQIQGYFDCPVDNLFAVPVMVVVHDELDIPAGELRFKFGGGNAGHNGLKSITELLGTPDFYRLRMGIGRPPHKGDVTNWVLGRPEGEDAQNIQKSMSQAAETLYAFADKGLESAVRASKKTA